MSTPRSSENQSSHASYSQKAYRKSGQSSCKSDEHKKSCTKKKNDSEEVEKGKQYSTIPFYVEKYAKFDDTMIQIQKSSPLPVIEPKSEKYSPLPYVFRLPDKVGSQDITTMVRCPPFFIQLDHTIAVVWSLYASDETKIPVGINQLQWAYSFLKNAKNKDDTYPRDVQHCLDSISDELINQYAQMAELDPTPTTSDDSISSFNPPAHSSMKSEEGDGKGCTCAASSVKFSENTDSCSGASNEGTCFKTPDYPFSVTYNDMRLHNYALQQRLLEKRREEKEKPICNMTNNTTVNSFLNDMRKDQLKKILAELDRLHSIEEYIFHNDQDFQPYIDENDQQLKEFLAQKMNSCKGDECSNKGKKEKGKDKDKQEEVEEEEKREQKDQVVCQTPSQGSGQSNTNEDGEENDDGDE